MDYYYCHLLNIMYSMIQVVRQLGWVALTTRITLQVLLGEQGVLCSTAHWLPSHIAVSFQGRQGEQAQERDNGLQEEGQLVQTGRAGESPSSLAEVSKCSYAPKSNFALQSRGGGGRPKMQA